MSQNKTSEVGLVGLTRQLYSSHIYFSVRGNDVELFSSVDFLSAVDNTEWVTDLCSFFQTFPSVPYVLQTLWESLWDQLDTKHSWRGKERSGDLCNYVEGECVHVFVRLVNRACLWLSCVCVCVWCVCVCWIGVRVGRDAQTDCFGTDVHLSEQLELKKLKGLHIVSTRHRV